MASPKTDYLVPAILSALLAVLGWMATNIAGIRETIASAMTHIQDLDRRVDNLETLFLHQKS